MGLMRASAASVGRAVRQLLVHVPGSRGVEERRSARLGYGREMDHGVGGRVQGRGVVRVRTGNHDTGVLLLVGVLRRLRLGLGLGTGGTLTCALVPGGTEGCVHGLVVAGKVMLATEDTRAAGLLARVRTFVSMH